MNPDPAACGSEGQQGEGPESTIDFQEYTDLCLYLDKADLEKYLVTEEELNKREAARLQAQVEIRTNLQQHVPWFLRSAIQGLVHQIDATNSKLNNGEASPVPELFAASVRRQHRGDRKRDRNHSSKLLWAGSCHVMILISLLHIYHASCRVSEDGFSELTILLYA